MKKTKQNIKWDAGKVTCSLRDIKSVTSRPCHNYGDNITAVNFNSLKTKKTKKKQETFL